MVRCAIEPLREDPRLRFLRLDVDLPTRGQWREGFAVADMNGDGNLDLVHGPPRKGLGKPVIFLGNDEGRFVPWETAYYPDLPYDYGDVQVADFDGNGLPDLALASHLRGLLVLIQETSGSFAPWGEGLEYRLPSGQRPPHFTSRALAVTDWNGDRLPDLVALNEGPVSFGPRDRALPTVLVYLNRLGLWQPIAAPVTQAFGSRIAIADADGDRAPDALVGLSTAGDRRVVARNAENSISWLELEAVAASDSVSAVGAVRIAGSARDRVALATISRESDNSTCTKLRVIDVGESGQTAVPLRADISSDAWTRIVSADFNYDRRTDLLAVRRSGAMSLFRATDEGFVLDAELESPRSMRGCDVSDAETADLDRDELLEVVVSFAGEVTPGLGDVCSSSGGFLVWKVLPR